MLTRAHLHQHCLCCHLPSSTSQHMSLLPFFSLPSCSLLVPLFCFLLLSLLNSVWSRSCHHYCALNASIIFLVAVTTSALFCYLSFILSLCACYWLVRHQFSCFVSVSLILILVTMVFELVIISAWTHRTISQVSWYLLGHAIVSIFVAHNQNSMLISMFFCFAAHCDCMAIAFHLLW